MRRKHTYANASQVKCYADGGPVKKAKKKGKKKVATPEMLGTGGAAQAGTTLRDKRAQQMKDMGLADGGKPKMKPHKPAKVKSPILERQKKKGYGPGGSQTPGAKGTYPKRKK